MPAPTTIDGKDPSRLVPWSTTQSPWQPSHTYPPSIIPPWLLRPGPAPCPPCLLLSLFHRGRGPLEVHLLHRPGPRAPHGPQGAGCYPVPRAPPRPHPLPLPEHAQQGERRASVPAAQRVQPFLPRRGIAFLFVHPRLPSFVLCRNSLGALALCWATALPARNKCRMDRSSTNIGM